MTSISLKVNNANNNFIENLNNIHGMALVEENLYSTVSNDNSKINDICIDFINSGGKRIRPLLVLASSQCFNNLKPNTIHAAVALELIHMASLIHDDIIDNATSRRNRPSVNIQIGNQSSVLIGDYLFAKAFEVLSKNRLNDEMALIVEAIEEMCDGEITQSINRFNIDQTKEDYYKCIKKKTGVLISACCQVGAMCGGANFNEIQSLKGYGTYIGYAFQIIDDILDFTGEKNNIGKPVANDLREGNITLPIIKLMENRKYKDLLASVTKNKSISEENYKEVLRVLKDNYAFEETYGEAKYCIENAKSYLNEVSNSYYKELLMELADNLLVRCK